VRGALWLRRASGRGADAHAGSRERRGGGGKRSAVCRGRAMWRNGRGRRRLERRRGRGSPPARLIPATSLAAPRKLASSRSRGADKISPADLRPCSDSPTLEYRTSPGPGLGPAVVVPRVPVPTGLVPNSAGASELKPI
jgi:hypothetical protein